MKSEEVKLNIQEPGTYIVKFGSLPADREPISLRIEGNIDSVTRYLKARINEVSQKPSIITADLTNGVIQLYVDENSAFGTVVTGKLTMHPDFLKWGINTEKQYSSLDLAQMIKMNRFMFPSTSKAMELVAIFQTLKAKVQKEVELSDDKRGNKTNLQSQVVLNMSIPTAFTIKVPLFKGFPEKEIEVEIAINADTLNIQLISPAASDIINTALSESINYELKEILQFLPDQIPVIFK